MTNCGTAGCEGTGGETAGREKPGSSPPGKVFVVLLITLALLVNIAIVTLFQYLNRQHLDNFVVGGTDGRNSALPMADHSVSALVRHIGRPILYILLLVGIASAILSRRSIRHLEKVEWAIFVFFATIGSGWLCTGTLAYHSHRVKEGAYRRTIERANPVIEALDDFRDDKGEYPDSLEALVPEYLQGIPTTGMPAFPEYTYSRDQRTSKHYVLSVHMPVTYGGSEDLWYWPERDYNNPDKPRPFLIRERQRMDGWLHTYEGVD